MKIIKKISNYNKRNFVKDVEDNIRNVLDCDREVQKLDEEIYDHNLNYCGWEEGLGLLTKEDKKELEHFLLMLSNRTKRRALQKLKGLR
jgi:hypothetical protein